MVKDEYGNEYRNTTAFGNYLWLSHDYDDYPQRTKYELKLTAISTFAILKEARDSYTDIFKWELEKTERQLADAIIEIAIEDMVANKYKIESIPFDMYADSRIPSNTIIADPHALSKIRKMPWNQLELLQKENKRLREENEQLRRNQ